MILFFCSTFDSDPVDDDFTKELEMFKSFCSAPRPAERQKVKINMAAIKTAKNDS